MKQIIIILFLSLAIISNKKEKQEIKLNLADSSTIDKIEKKDELIGDYSFSKGGTMDMRIYKTNGRYYVNYYKKGKVIDNYELKDITKDDAEKIFKDGKTSEYFYYGLQTVSGAGGIAKVKKGYKMGSYTTFETGFIAFPWANNLYKKQRKVH